MHYSILALQNHVRFKSAGRNRKRGKHHGCLSQDDLFAHVDVEGLVDLAAGLAGIPSEIPNEGADCQLSGRPKCASRASFAAGESARRGAGPAQRDWGSTRQRRRPEHSAQRPPRHRRARRRLVARSRTTRVVAGRLCLWVWANRHEGRSCLPGQSRRGDSPRRHPTEWATWSCPPWCITTFAVSAPSSS